MVRWILCGFVGFAVFLRETHHPSLTLALLQKITCVEESPAEPTEVSTVHENSILPNKELYWGRLLSSTIFEIDIARKRASK